MNQPVSIQGYFSSIQRFLMSLVNPHLLLSLACTLLATYSAASVKTTNQLTPITMCVFDIIGKNGPTHNIMNEYRVSAIKWGVELTFKSYTNDRIAAEDFNAGVCDMVNLPGIRARNYNHFTGSLNSIGAIPSYQHLT